MIEYPIIATSVYAYRLCSAARNGMVHSVYQKTINLLMDGHLISLQAKHSPLSPISLITALSPEEMSVLPVSPDDPATIKENSLCVQSMGEKYCFSFSGSEQIDLELADGSCKDPQKLVQNIQCVLDYCQCGGFRGLFTKKQGSEESDQFLTLAAAKKYLDEGDLFLKQNDYENAAKRLVKLIGLGIGLTPSGDDFLCGVLAGLNLSVKQGHPFVRLLKEAVKSSLQNTNDISRAFLHCACIGQFSRAVNTLTRSPSPTAIYESFSAIGHSSGMDTLCGILYILKYVSP